MSEKTATASVNVPSDTSDKLRFDKTIEDVVKAIRKHKNHENVQKTVKEIAETIDKIIKKLQEIHLKTYNYKSTSTISGAYLEEPLEKTKTRIPPHCELDEYCTGKIVDLYISIPLYIKTAINEKINYMIAKLITELDKLKKTLIRESSRIRIVEQIIEGSAGLLIVEYEENGELKREKVLIDDGVIITDKEWLREEVKKHIQ